MQTDHDQIFKILIQEFFKEFMELFLPKEAKAINFKKIEFLDKELFTDLPTGGKRQMDLVVKVTLKGGGKEFILVHTEFESKKDSKFPLRMYQYYSQLFLRHKKPIIPIAVFLDDAVWSTPLKCEYEIGFKEETYVSFRYKQIKLKHYHYRDFLDTKNPLVFALMAKMDYSRKERVRLKADFLRLICGSTINEARKSLLLEFVESYMKLQGMEKNHFEDLVDDKKYKEVKKVITTYERRGIEKGIEKGREEGREEGIEKSFLKEIKTFVKMYEAKFGKMSSTIKNRTKKITSQEQLEKLMLQLILCESKTDLKW